MISRIEVSFKCPSCHQKGRSVKSVTIESLLKSEVLEESNSHDGFYFCCSRECDVVYFQSEANVVFNRADVKVVVGQKEKNNERQICYCFDYTAAAIEKDVRESGDSAIPDVIAKKCRNGEDFCDQKNPQGFCCLGNVREVLNNAKMSLNTVGDSKKAELNVGVIAQVGALFAAILASACCWLPLLLIGMGVSGGTIAASFENWRPVAIPVTFVLLGLAFYFSYRKPKVSLSNESCCDEEIIKESEADCCSSDKIKSVKKMNRVLLWVVTCFVLAFVFFPEYVGVLTEELETTIIKLEGVKNQEDVSKLEEALLGVKSIVSVKIDLEKQQVAIGVEKGEKLPVELVLSTIEAAGGYRGSLADQISWKLKIEGMTCEGCSNLIKSRVTKLPGVFSASINFENGQAIISIDEKVKKSVLVKAIESAGFKVIPAKEAEFKD